jgi:hypothetical protein
MKKEYIGGLIILGGVAFMGYTWFKRNKPTIANKQLTDLTNQLNNLSTSADTIDKPFEYTQTVKDTQGQNPFIQSSLSLSEQAQINQGVKENIDCSLGIFSVWTGTDCTQYNLHQQQLSNPNNINTSNCNPPKLIITNVLRADANYPPPSGEGSYWNIYFNICGANINSMIPFDLTYTIKDNSGTQQKVIKNNLMFVGGGGGNFNGQPSNATITIDLKAKDGTVYSGTYNYKK